MSLNAEGQVSSTFSHPHVRRISSICDEFHITGDEQRNAGKNPRVSERKPPYSDLGLVGI